MASSKRSDESKSIAIAIELDVPVPHHLGVYRGIQQYANEHEGWSTVVDPHLVGLTGTTGGSEYRGVVGRISTQVAEVAKAAGIPMVNTYMNTPVPGLPCAYYDVFESGRIGGEHLLARGFRHFAFMGHHRDRYGATELAGFEHAIKEQGFRPPRKFKTSETYEKQAKTFARFRQELYRWIVNLPRPVGIYSTAAILAQYAVRLCSELEIRVPHEVGIVAQYNPTVSLWTEPTLSSIDNDDEQVGYRAAQLLGRLMQGKTAVPKEPILVKPKGLIVRASSDAFVVDDPLAAKALRFIADHSRDAITVADVAVALDTTTRTLARRFEQLVGRSVYGEISRMRVEYIKRQLQDSNAPLGTLAKECGFTTASHFTLFFRKATGLSPGQYRKKFRK